MRLLLAGSCLAALFLAAGCGGSGSDDGASRTGTPTAPATSGAADDPALAPQAAGLAWIAAVQRLFAGGTDPQEKAADVVGGDDLVATFRRAERVLGLTLYTVDVTRPRVTGTTGTGTVELREGTSHRGRVLGVTTAGFRYDGRVWRLDRTGACAVLGLVHVRCP